MIKESRYLEIKPVYLQLNAPLFVLAGLNDILWLFSIGGSFHSSLVEATSELVKSQEK